MRIHIRIAALVFFCAIGADASGQTKGRAYSVDDVVGHIRDINRVAAPAGRYRYKSADQLSTIEVVGDSLNIRSVSVIVGGSDVNAETRIEGLVNQFLPNWSDDSRWVRTTMRASEAEPRKRFRKTVDGWALTMEYLRTFPAWMLEATPPGKTASAKR